MASISMKLIEIFLIFTALYKKAALIFVLYGMAVVSFGYSFLAQASTELRFFTHDRKQLLFGDPKESALEFAILEKNRFRGKVGNFIHIVSLLKDRLSVDFGVDAMMIGTFHGEDDWETPLDSIDGKIGGYLEFRNGRFQTKASFEHLSAHLSDGKFKGSIPPLSQDEKALLSYDANENLYAIRLDENFSNYSREFLKFIVSYKVLNTQLYLGLSRTVHIPEPSELKSRYGSSYQAGFETTLKLFHFPLPFFISSDFQWKHEHNYLLEQNHLLGLDFKGFRPFASYYEGFDQRGIYWNLKEQYLALGLSFPMY